MAKASKRDQILDTAGKLFMQFGFQAVSVDQIAAAVPVSKPTLYAHFKHKKALFIAVVGLRCQQALAGLKADTDGDYPVEKSLMHFGRHFVDLLLSKEALQFHRVIVGESENFHEMAKMFFESGPKQTHLLLSDYLAQQHKKGTLDVPDPALSADIFLGMLRGRLHLQCLLGLRKGEVSASEREKLVKLAVKIFIKGQKR
jgi:TetR/AcrR family transcriptional repressor of mexJK operon